MFNEFKSLLNKENPDIIHVHNFFPQITPSIFFAAKEKNIPIIQTLHNYRLICPSGMLMHNNKVYEKSIDYGPFSTVKDRVYRNSFLQTFLVALMISYHKKINTWNEKVCEYIALTNFSKGKFVDAGFNDQKISVKPNFVFDIKSKNSRKRNFALFIGRIGEEKGINVLLEAWEKIDFPLVIAGKGPLEELVQNNNNPLVTYVGHQNKNEINNLLNSASFLVIPSIWFEGFPMVILEAFSAGLPVIGSKIGSIKEVVKNNITGLHFETNSSEDLANKVNSLINDAELLKKLSINSRNEYLQNYTPEANYSELISIYNKILNRKD